MLLVCCSGSEFLGDAHPERPALETSLGKILIEAVEVERQDPRKLGQTELAAHGMGLVAGCARCAAAIAGNLPRVITGRTDFKQMSVHNIGASAVIMAARLTLLGWCVSLFACFVVYFPSFGG